MSTLSALYVRLPNWVGDVCMSLPSVRALLNTGLPIVACGRPWATELLAGFDLAGFVPMQGQWRADRAAVSAYRRKSRHGHVRGLLLPDSLSSAMVFKFGGIPSAGYRDDGRSLILRWPVNKPESAQHAVQSWYHLTSVALKRWNLSVEPDRPAPQLGLEATATRQSEAAAALAAAGLVPGRFILIAPTAIGLHHGKDKVWPWFDPLARSLQQRGYMVAMCPPPSEVAAARRNAPTAICLPPLELGAFATLTQLASLVVCNDSGVSHVAAAAGANQLTLFGVTRPERTGPWSAKASCLGSALSWPLLADVEKQVLALLQ